MGKGSYILGGALQGIGAGLIQQHQANQEAEARSATMRFQAMMAQQKSAAEDARAEREHGWQIERDNNQARLKADQSNRDAENTMKRDAVLHGNDVEMERLKASNQQSVERLKSSLSMSEFEKKAATELANDVTRMGRQVGHTEITADGRMILYAKDGSVLRASPPGTFNPKNTPDEEGDLLGSRGTTAKAASPSPRMPQKPVPKPAPAPQPPKKPAQSLEEIFGQPQPGVASTLTNTFSR